MLSFSFDVSTAIHISLLAKQYECKNIVKIKSKEMGRILRDNETLCMFKIKYSVAQLISAIKKIHVRVVLLLDTR